MTRMTLMLTLAVALASAGLVSEASADPVCDCDDSNPCRTDSCLPGTSICAPVPDGTVCGGACDMCLTGTCVAFGDADGDAVCDYEDNCSDAANSGQEDLDGDGEGDVCDVGDAWLVVAKAKVKQASTGRANGSIGVDGRFLATGGFDVTGGVTVRVLDGADTDESYSFTSCVTTTNGKARCRSEDHKQDIQFKPGLASGLLFFKLRRKNLSNGQPPVAPLFVAITAGTPVTGIDFAGSIDVPNCKGSARGNKVSCKL